jgi:hypothetical protein
LIWCGLGGSWLRLSRGLRRLFRLRESSGARSQENAGQTGRAETFQQEGHQISFPMIGRSKLPSHRP